MFQECDAAMRQGACSLGSIHTGICKCVHMTRFQGGDRAKKLETKSLHIMSGFPIDPLLETASANSVSALSWSRKV